jgi:malic enzyme
MKKVSNDLKMTQNPSIKANVTESNLDIKKQINRLRDEALKYHEEPVPGKFVIMPSKSLNNPHDLALAYSPRVAEPCLDIAK